MQTGSYSRTEGSGFLAPRRLRRFLVAALAGIAIGFAVLLATSDGLRTIRGGRIGGDLPAFYGAARIVRAGETGRLYDPAAQEAAERDLLPGTGGRLPFPYPPYVALAYVPLTWLPFKIAYAVHAIVMALCLLAALAVLRPLLHGVRAELVALFAAGLLFYPIFRAVLGGQNTPLSLLCAAAVAAALARQRDLIAGLWTGAWLFKPQYAVPVAGLLLLRNIDRRRFLAGFAAVATGYYIVGWSMAGWDWPLWWWRDGAMAFTLADYAIDRGNGISFAEIADEYGLRSLNWIAVAAAGAFALWVVRRRRLHPVAVIAVATLTAVLIAPHTLFYDGGLAALGLIVAAALRPSLLPAVAAIWLLSWAQPLRAYLPLPPMTVVVVLSMWLAAGAEQDLPVAGGEGSRE
jgi:Glycosyltransferase family 87